ncbi:hypothetical protein [Kitasatospora sp. NPDC089509]|uniref:hypothetical protein n=1 Tax=Kitasatospora sp. NPDC089509 TaxID=3364079 RepID=UPI00381AD3AD
MISSSGDKERATEILVAARARLDEVLRAYGGKVFEVHGSLTAPGMTHWDGGERLYEELVWELKGDFDHDPYWVEQRTTLGYRWDCADEWGYRRKHLNLTVGADGLVELMGRGASFPLTAEGVASYLGPPPPSG